MWTWQAWQAGPVPISHATLVGGRYGEDGGELAMLIGGLGAYKYRVQVCEFGLDFAHGQAPQVWSTFGYRETRQHSIRSIFLNSSILSCQVLYIDVFNQTLLNYSPFQPLQPPLHLSWLPLPL